MSGRSVEDKLARCLALRAGSAPGVLLGIGDDAALLRAPGLLAVTSDVVVEGVDFDVSYTPLPFIGWKALAASLSDVAAMGGVPRFALASLQLPKRSALRLGLAIMSGLLSLARRRGVTLVGGDLSATPGPIALDVTVLGTVRRPVHRSGARPGHLLAVTGPLGLAALGLERLRVGARLHRARGLERQLVMASLRPNPDPFLGARLAPFASAMIDISDGLSTDLDHLCRASRCGAVIDEALLPLAPAAAAPVATRRRAALHGGEDYRLLLSFPARRRAALERFGAVVIGRTVARRGIDLRARDGRLRRLLPAGHRHF